MNPETDYEHLTRSRRCEQEKENDRGRTSTQRTNGRAVVALAKCQ
jgi:hypothetical protein